MKRLIGLLLVVIASAARGEALFPAPSFVLTDQDGRQVSNQDLRGKVWVVDFIFTRCMGPCPMMTQKMVGLAGQIGSPNVRFVSISVDPEFDRPAVLKQYARERGATDPRILFLTGDPKTIYGLIQNGFKLTAQAATPVSPIMHDERFLLVDAAGDVSGVYHSSDPASMDKLVADATALAPTDRAALLARFPAINASLNATAGILLCLAMMLIKGKRVRLHAITMILAVVASTAFLVCYVTYHVMRAQAGTGITKFPESPLRPVYLVILISHTLLAVVVVPLVVVTLTRAARRQWDRHRRIASPTFWIWLYVSATGVIVYWMLYQLAPRLVVQL
jgi:protein SCO1/2